MSHSSPRLADHCASNAARPPSVKERIERRLEVLRDWLKEGVPTGKVVPPSLTVAREWNDPELGIIPISSPNEFTTTVKCPNRKLVADVKGLLTELRKRYSKPARAAARRSAQTEKFDRRAYDRLLEEATSQWHSERDQRLQEKKRADSADARSVALLEEIAQKDQLIADLRREIGAQKGLKAVR